MIARKSRQNFLDTMNFGHYQLSIVEKLSLQSYYEKLAFIYTIGNNFEVRNNLL